MAIQTFAAIDIGSYELEMKIFEVSRGKGIREIDDLVRRIDLGTDTYSMGKISYVHVDQVRRTLLEFRKIMETYGVAEYKAYGTSAIREMQNASIVLSGLERDTGIHIDILSNSEQRFLDYKSVASSRELFEEAMEKSTAIIDIGGGSIQISLFNKDKLVSTQNLKLGVLRLHEEIHNLNAPTSKMQQLVEELVEAQLVPFEKLYLKEKRIQNIVIIDDYLSDLVRRRGMDRLSTEEYEDLFEKVHIYNRQNLAKILGVAEDNIPLLYINAIMVHSMERIMRSEKLFFPGVTLCDGMVYEYAEKKNILPPSHDFEGDIIAFADNISKRYKGNMERSLTMESIALRIFEATRKIHGLGHREELLLRIAVRLHDCGRYISFINLAECSYNIIMATEIIGLSHLEREIVANVVRYNHTPFVYYEQQEEASDLSAESYLVIAKLTAILRIANGLDRSHKHKFQDIRVVVKDKKLMIYVHTDQDITVETGMIDSRADFFEEIFGYRPVIRRK